MDFREDSSAVCSASKFMLTYLLHEGQECFEWYFSREIVSSNLWLQ